MSESMQYNSQDIKSRKPIRNTPTSFQNGYNNEDDRSFSSEYEEEGSAGDSSPREFYNRGVTQTPETPRQKIQNSEQNQRVKSNKNTVTSKIKVLLISMVLIGIAVVVAINMNSVTSCSFEDMQKQYPEQLIETWQIVKSGVENIMNKRSKMPAVYLLLHQGGSGVTPLVRQIVERAAKCLDKSKKAAIMSSDDFSLSQGDYGHAIEQFKVHVKSHRVVLIENLNDIPSKAARALHTICDTYSPIKRDVVIFLTLKTDKHLNGKAMAIAEKALHERWRTLSSNELDALIARVTDQVAILRN